MVSSRCLKELGLRAELAWERSPYGEMGTPVFKRRLHGSPDKQERGAWMPLLERLNSGSDIRLTLVYVLRSIHLHWPAALAAVVLAGAGS